MFYNILITIKYYTSTIDTIKYYSCLLYTSDAADE